MYIYICICAYRYIIHNYIADVHEPKETSVYRHYSCYSFGSTFCTLVTRRVFADGLSSDKLWDAKQTILNIWTRGPLREPCSRKQQHTSMPAKSFPWFPLISRMHSYAYSIVYSQVYHYLVITLSLLLQNRLTMTMTYRLRSRTALHGSAQRASWCQAANWNCRIQIMPHAARRHCAEASSATLLQT